jgi:hypothetical protein
MRQPVLMRLKTRGHTRRNGAIYRGYLIGRSRYARCALCRGDSIRYPWRARTSSAIEGAPTPHWPPLDHLQSRGSERRWQVPGDDGFAGSIIPKSTVVSLSLLRSNEGIRPTVNNRGSLRLRKTDRRKRKRDDKIKRKNTELNERRNPITTSRLRVYALWAFRKK